MKEEHIFFIDGNIPKPKLPLIPYLIFANEHRDAYKDKPMVVMAKEIGMKWKNSSKEEQLVYQKKSDKLKEEYKVQLEKYNEDLLKTDKMKVLQNQIGSVLGHFKSKPISKKDVHSQKWLKMVDVKYQDHHQKPTPYESVERTTRGSSAIDGVDILAIVDTYDNSKHLLLTVQYRPPLEALAIEFPTGLVDDGETAVEAAIRELKEETGFEMEESNIKRISPAVCLEPSMTNSNTKLIYANLHESQMGDQNLEESEFIKIILVPLSILLDTLDKFQDSGCIVDGKVYAYALGLMSSSFMKE
mmetsp:Transcript_6812/g.9934  ORF Transcript_6812/g.9934 Transcript_6812/m.9934 type:complete len:301 (-) Transcript_6812:36-938(-)